MQFEHAHRPAHLIGYRDHRPAGRAGGSRNKGQAFRAEIAPQCINRSGIDILNELGNGRLAYIIDHNAAHAFQGDESKLPAILDPANAAYRGNAKTDESARFAFAFTGEEGAYDLNYSGMWAATASFPLVSAIETELILAEAEWRGNSDPDAALTHLNNARAMLAAQFPEGKYEAYTLADFDNGGIASRAGFSRNDALLYEILEEKYVSLMGQMEVLVEPVM